VVCWNPSRLITYFLFFQVILEAHIDSKGTDNLQTEIWKCNFCDPIREFRDYFEFSEHFFNQHMQPGLQKISEFNKQQ